MLCSVKVIIYLRTKRNLSNIYNYFLFTNTTSNSNTTITTNIDFMVYKYIYTYQSHVHRNGRREAEDKHRDVGQMK